MSKPFRRGNRYYIRKHVPLDLVEMYQGKLEIVRALGTSDYREAVQLVAAQETAFNEQFARDRLLATATHRWQESVIVDPTGGDVSMQTVTRVFADHKADFISRFLDDRLAQARIALGLDQKPPAAPVQVHQPSPTSAKANVPTSAQSLDALVQVWAKARTPEPHVVRGYERTVSRFKEIVGDISVRQITKAHIIEFKDGLLIDRSVIVTQQSVSQMHSLLNIAIGEDWIKDNPSKGVRVYESNPDNLKVAKDTRPPFDMKTLNNLFASPAYQPGFRTRAKASAGPATYWLPLLGLFTGARIEELCQLRPKDVYEETYIDDAGVECKAWVLQIVEDATDGLAVKNKHSIRRIPIHHELINRGFIEFIKKQADAQHSRIFDKLIRDQDGRDSSAFGQWWTQYLRRECHPSHPKMTFHSFRHLSKDIMRNCRIGKDERDAINGHAEQGEGGNYGAQYFPLLPLINAMNRYVMRGVILPGPYQE